MAKIAENDQRDIENSFIPFQEACRREGYEVRFHLVPIPNPDREFYQNRPIRFQLKVIEPGIRGRHYLDTWIYFRRLLRETVDKSVRERLCDFNIYPTNEATNFPLPPIPLSETTELFNRFLYIYHWALVDIRNLLLVKEEKSSEIAEWIADGLHNVPHDMFHWGYGNDGVEFSTFEFIFEEIERLEEQRLKLGEEDYYFCRYLHFLEMPYEQFVEERLRSYNGRQTGIVFNPNRSDATATTIFTVPLAECRRRQP